MSYKRPERRLVLIPDGGTTPVDPVHLGDYTLAGIITPAGMEGVAITFTACDTRDGTFMPVHDDAGAALSITVAASRATGITAAKRDALAPWPWIRPVLGTAQTGAATLTLVLKRA